MPQKKNTFKQKPIFQKQPFVKSNFQKKNNKLSINNQIKALSIRVIDHNNQNLGIMSKEEALKIAKDVNLDLIEVSNSANPPICKIADYGKWAFDQQKKLKEVKAKQNISETKNIQLSLAIGQNDIILKTKQAAIWLKEGHRVKIEMMLKGREKYLEEAFIKNKLNNILAIIPFEYKIAEALKKVPKGFMIVLEKSK